MIKYYIETQMIIPRLNVQYVTEKLRLIGNRGTMELEQVVKHAE